MLIALAIDYHDNYSSDIHTAASESYLELEVGMARLESEKKNIDMIFRLWS